ncbi:hypothetical protein N657DRAFT_412892 [Parathielavia appendiculata]|uniref:Uncharacterized protein n=1 Tax=Parathielavia appendiculata TaxID=2587402 RepID=A0AAN6U1F7_9PEZI|nr:hypothetical protein N657DRAFT_412892 [Parathielavia appendiculata]
MVSLERARKTLSSDISFTSAVACAWPRRVPREGASSALSTENSSHTHVTRTDHTPASTSYPTSHNAEKPLPFDRPNTRAACPNPRKPVRHGCQLLQLHNAANNSVCRIELFVPFSKNMAQRYSCTLYAITKLTLCDGHHPKSGQLAHTRSILLQREQELDDRNGRATRP